MTEMPLNIRTEQTEGCFGWLRKDIELLRKTLRKKTLVEGLRSKDIRRALEVGVGNDFSALEELANLREKDGRPYFTPENLWAIDPVMSGEGDLGYLHRKGLLESFTREITTVEDLANRVRRGELAPFDLVFCKGVASVGGIASLEIKEKRKVAFIILEAMRDCLSRHGFLVSAAFSYDTVLPYCRRDLQRMGLEVVGFEQATGQSAQDWVEILRDLGIFPKSPKENFYNSVISTPLERRFLPDAF